MRVELDETKRGAVARGGPPAAGVSARLTPIRAGETTGEVAVEADPETPPPGVRRAEEVDADAPAWPCAGAALR